MVDSGGFFDILKGMASGDTILNEMCNNLNACGINARVLEKDSSELIPVDKFLGLKTDPLYGTIKVEGRNIELIQLPRQGSGGGGGGSKQKADVNISISSGSRARGGAWLYVLRTDTSMGKELEAKLKPIEKGFVSKEVVGYEWKGGGIFGGETKLSTALSSDSTLQQMLMKNFTKAYINVDANEKHRYVSIWGINVEKVGRQVSVRFKGFDPKATFNMAKQLGQMAKGDDSQVRDQILDSLPTIEEFEVYDRIALDIKNLVAGR